MEVGAGESGVGAGGLGVGVVGVGKVGERSRVGNAECIVRGWGMADRARQDRAQQGRAVRRGRRGREKVGSRRREGGRVWRGRLERCFRGYGRRSSDLVCRLGVDLDGWT